MPFQYLPVERSTRALSVIRGFESLSDAGMTETQRRCFLFQVILIGHTVPLGISVPWASFGPAAAQNRRTPNWCWITAVPR